MPKDFSACSASSAFNVAFFHRLSEVDLNSKLQHARGQRPERLQPIRAIARVDPTGPRGAEPTGRRRRGTRVQQIEEVEQALEARRANAERPRQSNIELRPPILIERPGRDQIYCRVARTTSQTAAKRGADLRIRDHVARENHRTPQTSKQ